ncbi:MAG: CDP-archaeol synthase [Ruminococcaceae bacterium]|nr:CDP-archaeol synthase [Oscillospiraceae bacterium]
MLKRTITAICAIAIFIPICYFSDTVIFPAAMAIVATVGAYEMLGCVGCRKNYLISVPSCILTLLMPLVPIFTEAKVVEIQFALCVVYQIFVFSAVVFSRGKIDFKDASAAFTGVFYVAVTFTCISNLTSLGRYTYLLVFIGPWVSDTFAYFCGRLFGRHKLIPEVSPKKTVEGSVGGIVFGAVSFVVYALIIKSFFNDAVTPNYVVLAVLGAVVSVVSQIGDLTASAIKRRYNIKDYGTVFPGHGGVLDRFDSVMLTAPLLYIITQLPFLEGMLI